ncbi:MAG: tetratricopeptide repeat protein, partial [Ignavibacteriaceae bacterium]
MIPGIIFFGCSTGENVSYNMGLESYNEGRYLTAINYFNQAFLENPADPEIYFYRANAKLKLEDYDGAIDDYSKAIILNNKVKEYFLN